MKRGRLVARGLHNELCVISGFDTTVFVALRTS